MRRQTFAKPMRREIEACETDRRLANLGKSDTISFGGCMSVAAGLGTPLKCVGVAAATPALITVAAELIIQLFSPK